MLKCTFVAFFDVHHHFLQKLVKIKNFWFLVIFRIFSKIAKKCHFWQFSSKFLIGLYGRYISTMVSTEMFRHQKTHFWAILILIIICWFYIILLRNSIFWPFLKSLSVSSSLSVSHRNFWPQKYSQNVEYIIGSSLYFISTNLDQ